MDGGIQGLLRAMKAYVSKFRYYVIPDAFPAGTARINGTAYKLVSRWGSAGWRTNGTPPTLVNQGQAIAAALAYAVGQGDSEYMGPGYRGFSITSNTYQRAPVPPPFNYIMGNVSLMGGEGFISANISAESYGLILLTTSMNTWDSLYSGNNVFPYPSSGFQLGEVRKTVVSNYKNRDFVEFVRASINDIPPLLPQIPPYGEADGFSGAYQVSTRVRCYADMNDNFRFKSD